MPSLRPRRRPQVLEIWEALRGSPQVTLRNDGRIEHTAADVDANGNVRSRVIKPVPLSSTQQLTITFPRPGTYHYICTFHPTLMRGTVIVTQP